MSTLEEDAAALLARVDQNEDGARSRLTPDDRALIFRLHAKGHLSQAEIARAVGWSQATVSRTLALIDTRKEARTILESGAAKMAQTVVDTKDAGTALKGLGQIGVVDPHDSHAPRVQINIGMPGHPIELPAISGHTASPVVQLTPLISEGDDAA